MLKPAAVESFIWTENISDETDEMIEACVHNILKNLERAIVANRHNTQTANRFATMNKFIQVNYLINKERP